MPISSTAGRPSICFSVNYVAFLADVAKPVEALWTSFRNPVIVGNPKTGSDADWIFPDLPRAEMEAAEAFDKHRASHEPPDGRKSRPRS